MERAIEHYTAALKLEPSLWQIDLQLSAANLALNRLALARQAIEKVIEHLSQYADSLELKQANVRAQLLLGEIALAEAKKEEAEKAFRKVLELNPQTARAHAGLAEMFLSSNKFNEAAAEAKIALDTGDQRTNTYALYVEALIAAHRHDEALSVLNELLKREPGFTPALRYRAEVFAARNDFNSAIKDLQAALTFEPRLQDKLRLAEWLARTKQYDRASALYQQALKDDPANKEAQTALAALLVESGKGAEAIAQLESLIQTQPNRADVRAQLAELYLAAQPEKALEQYSAAAKLEPANPAHQLGVGAALVKLRRFQEAVPALRPVLAAKPELAYFAHTNLATALFELDDFANAAREFVWILNQQREQKRAAITLYFLGICFDKLGDLEQAQKVYEQFLSLASAENQLEIDKVKLRLPPLKRQLEKGQGKHKKE
ncbi:MAG: tetratricopeptide repeat protein [Acidobacteria bacterium]|nr:tetratricopeptide repeat protein [Acidobacteriota bacterium]